MADIITVSTGLTFLDTFNFPSLIISLLRTTCMQPVTVAYYLTGVSRPLSNLPEKFFLHVMRLVVFHTKQAK